MRQRDADNRGDMVNDEHFDGKVDALKRLGAATVHEAMGQRGYVDAAIAPLDATSRLAGRAYTVDSKAGDNLLVHHALSQAGPGDVIVVDFKGFTRAAAIGDVMAYAAQERGIAGFVIDGAVRDAAAIVEMGLPVFCRGLCITGPTKSQPGKVNVPILVGGCPVRPGDVIVGDRDGLVVVPAAEVDETVRLAMAREAREAAIRTRLAQGTTTVELFGLGEALSRFGVTPKQP
jgi:4-hydroxy-4-methyl-2-oxoglutarate aldolase